METRVGIQRKCRARGAEVREHQVSIPRNGAIESIAPKTGLHGRDAAQVGAAGRA